MSLPYRAHEISIRRSPAGGERLYVNNTQDLMVVISEYYDGLDREMALAVVLDDLNGLLGIYEVARGGTTEVPVDTTNVMRPVILLGGTKVILVHNHPTNDLEPSEGDIRMAKGLFLVASLLDLDVADNVIVVGQTWRSIHEHPEFQRWFKDDLFQIASIMSGEDIPEDAKSEVMEVANAQ